MKFFKHMSLCVLLAASITPLYAQENVTLSIRDVMERPALFFGSNGIDGVVLVHQSGYDAASWTVFANQLQAAGIASIALESTSQEDVESGVQFLSKLGKHRIILIGASIGGAAIQGAVSGDDTEAVDLVILLGTAQGSMADLAKVDKLFVVSEHDFFSAQTYVSYEKASDPKELLVYPGAAHGQEMFTEEYGSELISIILDAIKK